MSEATSAIDCVIELALFDYDDTLVASKDYRRAAMVSTIERLDRPADVSGFERAYGLHFRELVAAVDPEGDFDSFLSSYIEHVRREPAPLLPGAREVLLCLRRKGVGVGIVTSSDSRLIPPELVAYGLGDVVDLVIGSEGPGPTKPDPEVLQSACAFLGHRSSLAVVYVGDAISDFRMASGAGMTFVGVCTGKTTRMEFIEAGAPEERLLDTLADAAPLLCGGPIE